MPPEAEIYLDNNATTPAIAEVARAVTGALTEGFGNPSSAHARGDLARRRLQRARETVAGFLGAEQSSLRSCRAAPKATTPCSAVYACRP